MSLRQKRKVLSEWRQQDTNILKIFQLRNFIA